MNDPTQFDAHAGTPVVMNPGMPPKPPGPRPGRMVGYVAMVVVGILAGGAAVAFATGAVGAPAATPTPTPSPTVEPTPSPTPVGSELGSSEAPVTIEFWADYQCPYCRLEDLLFGPSLMRQYVNTGIARIEYHDFAFLGQESIDAAVAARCAGFQEPAAQLRYHDALYTFQQGENQGRFVKDNLIQIAKIVGVPDAAAFTACLADRTVAAAVQAETAAGRNLGVTSTPTMRLHGPGGERVITGFNQEWTALRDAIEAVRVAGASPAPSPSVIVPTSPAPASAGPGSSGSPAPAASPSGSAPGSLKATPVATP